MLRPTAPADTDALIAMTVATGVFKPHEIVALTEVLDDYHATNREFGHVALTWEDVHGPTGFVYYAPTAMTDRTWELWWIVVKKELQGTGIGGQALKAVEERVRSAGGRLLLIETSSTSPYEPTRRFYVKHGYVVSAQIPDFYADGDDKVIFWKKLGS
jgi:GNAT superfamily N-acetyltransferase